MTAYPWISSLAIVLSALVVGCGGNPGTDDANTRSKARATRGKASAKRSGADPTDACTLLDDEQKDCEEVVEGDDAAACQQSASTFCASAVPSAAGSDACEQLEACCGQLDDEDDEEDCEALVEDADTAACKQGRAEFCG